MSERQTAEFESLVKTLASAGRRPAAQDLEKMAETLGRMFGVAADEVAILAHHQKSKSLKFIIPEKLSIMGSIPLTSTNALAARTARDRKGDIINNFSSARHASVFEGVPLGRNRGENIHKIVSVPIMNGKGVLGVIQISRKGHSVAKCGPDFTPKDLRDLTSLSPSLEQFLKLCQPE
jgi:hypothetical protein